MPLIHTLQIREPDSFYEEVVNAQRDMPDDQAQRMLAKLVLLLANQVGDRAVLSEAIRVASGQAAAA